MLNNTKINCLLFMSLISAQEIHAQGTGTDGIATTLHADDLKVVAQGETVYNRHCASCHGDMLEGQANWRQRDAEGYLPAPPHDETGHTWHHRDDLLFEITKYGAAVVIGDENYKTRMPAYEGVITDEDIVAVLSYIKNRWPAEERDYQESLNENDTNVFREVQPKTESSLLERLFSRD